MNTNKNMTTNAKTFMLGNKKLHLHFLTLVGSRLHKLNLDNADFDYKGVFVWDTELTAGLETQLETLSYKNTNKEEWENLKEQLNKEFNLNLKENDDFDLFEARKFMVTTLKNDFNMFDLLFSNLNHHFVSKEFNEVLLNKDNFLDMSFAFYKTTEMAKQALREAKKLSVRVRNEKESNDFNKNMARALQFLFSLTNFLKEQTYNAVLKDEQRFEVLEAKRGKKNLFEVEERFTELFLNLESLSKDKTLLNKSSDKELVNKLLVDLNLSQFKR